MSDNEKVEGAVNEAAPPTPEQEQMMVDANDAKKGAARRKAGKKRAAKRRADKVIDKMQVVLQGVGQERKTAIEAELRKIIGSF